MYCKNCGKQIEDKAVICPHCGVATDRYALITQPAVQTSKNNGFAIAGFVLSFFSYLAILGLVFSCIGLNYSKQPEYNGNGKSLSVAGIAISCVMLFFSIIISIL